MAIDPRIPMMGITPDIAGAMNQGILSGERLAQAPIRNQMLQQQVDMQSQQMQLTPLQLEAARQTIDLNKGTLGDAQQARDAKSNAYRYKLAESLFPLSLEQRAQAIEGARPDLTDMGIDVDDMLGKLSDEDLNGAMVTLEPFSQMGAGGRSGFQKGQSLTGQLPDGTPIVGFPTYDPSNNATGISWADATTGRPVQDASGVTYTDTFGETPSQKATSAALAARLTAEATASAESSQRFEDNMSQRNQQSATDMIKIREALTLSSQSAGGLAAPALTRLSKLLPGIDVSNEAALDAALTQISLDQLAKFKGPTTDYEFAVTQSIAGRISDTQQARNARLKSLQRSAWFNEREYKQYNRHKNNGGTSSNFRFNINEEIVTKRGTFTLSDLQDTALANNIGIDDVLNKLNKAQK